MANLLSARKIVAIVVVPVILVLIINSTIFLTILNRYTLGVSGEYQKLQNIFLILMVSSILLISTFISLIALYLTTPFKQLREVFRLAAKRYPLDGQDHSVDTTEGMIKNLVSLVRNNMECKRRIREMESKMDLEVKQKIEKATSNLRFEVMDEKQLAHSLELTLTQLREANKDLKESRESLKQKQEELQRSNLQLQAAEESLRSFNETLEQKVKERTAELQQANVHIQKLLELKSQFVNQVSHDLRTPLTPIMTLLPLVKDEVQKISDVKIKADINEMLERVVSNAEYLLNIVTETLSISRLDTGKVVFNLQPESMKDIIVEVIKNNEVVFKRDGIKTVDKASESLPKVYVDKMRVKEVLSNLISNAMKFMDKEKVLTFDAVKDKDFMIVKVKDTGIGIDKKFHSKIFTEFFKVDPSRHEHSSGLGLSICKRIVEKHGGTIWVESEVNKGTTFLFSLPIYKREKFPPQ